MATIKLFPLYLVVYYVTQRRSRPLLAVLISILALTLITVWVLGVDSYLDYMGTVLPWNSEFRIFGYNLSIAGFWHKLFHPLNEGERIIPVWRSLVLARGGTILSNLAITIVLIAFLNRAQTPAQCDYAFTTTMTAMLLVSPVTWDTSLLLLLLPITVLACHRQNPRSNWMPAVLLLILPIVWLPQPLLTTLFTGGRTITVISPSFLLGAASLKFYALLATFVSGLIALRLDVVSAQHGITDDATVV